MTAYYALCNEADGDIAALDLGYEEGLGSLVGLAVYTGPSGPAQEEDLRTWDGPAPKLLFYL